MLNTDFEDTIEGLAAVAVGVYIFAVIIQGNLKPFLSEIVKETGFVEFIVALFILYEITKVKSLRPVTIPLSIAAALILAMRVVSGADLSSFRRFASGDIGLFELANNVFRNQA